MGCCQTRDSNEIQLNYTPRGQDQTQLTFGNGFMSANKKSPRSNANHRYFSGRKKSEEVMSINEENDKKKKNVVTSPDKKLGTMSLAFTFKEEESKRQENPGSDAYNFIASKEESTRKNMEVLNNLTELMEFSPVKQSERIDEEEIKKKKDKLFVRIDNLSNNNEINDSQPIPRTDSENNVKIVKPMKDNHSKYRPYMPSSWIIDNVKKLEMHLKGVEENAQNEIENNDQITKIILEKPIQQKKKSKKANKFEIQ